MQVLCPIIVGRAAEIAALTEAVAAVARGDGGVVLIAGEAGIGKSRLAREAGAIASDAGMRTLLGRAVQTASPIPFRPLAEAISSWLRTNEPPQTPDLVPYHAALQAFVPEWSTPGVPSESTSFRLLEGVLRLVRSIAGRDGMLLVLEDMHWADADTLAVVEYLGDNLAGERVLCVGTIRSDEPGPALELARRLSARRTVTLLEPARLRTEEIARMADAALGEQAAAPLIRIVGERSEGVPFLIEEMLAAYLAAGHDEGDERAAAVALPASYRDLVRARMRALDDIAQTVVTAAALLGQSFEWTLLEAITELSRETVLEALRSGVAAQLLDASFESGFRFRHALVPETMVADLLPPERATLSRRAAEAIEATYPGLPGDWCERAAGLRESAGDQAEAARHLQEAGLRALHRGALASAEVVLEHARELVAADRWHVMGIDRQLVDVLVQAGKTARIREIGSAMLSFSTDKAGLIESAAAVSLSVPVARAFAEIGDWESARLYLDRSRQLADRIGNDRVRAELLVIEAKSRLATNDLPGANRAAEEAIRLGSGEREYEARLVLGEAARRSGHIDEAVTIFEALESDARQAGMVPARINALLGLGRLDLWRGTSARLVEARDLAAGVGAVASHARAWLLIGSTLIMRFELDAALNALRQCRDECIRYRLPLHADAAFAAAIAQAERGDEAAMEHAITEGTAADTGVVEHSPSPHAARAILALVREDRAAALANYERAIPAVSGTRELAFTPALWALLRTLEGDGAASREQAGRLWSAHLPDDAAALRSAEAIELGRAGRGAEAAAAFEAADTSIEALPLNRHLTRRLVAEAAIDGGWGAPAAWLRESLAFFETAGLDRVATACKALLRRAGAPVPRRGRGDSVVPPDLAARGLTSREMDVLRLVGRGLGNRDIAAELVLSARTIETHVASLMRKLAVDRRAQLIALAARLEPHGGT